MSDPVNIPLYLERVASKALGRTGALCSWRPSYLVSDPIYLKRVASKTLDGSEGSRGQGREQEGAAEEATLVPSCWGISSPGVRTRNLEEIEFTYTPVQINLFTLSFSGNIRTGCDANF